VTFYTLFGTHSLSVVYVINLLLLSKLSCIAAFYSSSTFLVVTE